MNDKRKNNRGGARKGAGRKKGVGITYDIQKYCNNMINEMLKDDAIRLKATKQLSMTFDDEKEDYLYIIKSDKTYKIGYSTNWKKREKSYKTHIPTYELIYLLKSYCSFELESDLHLMFEYKREHGEWFNLSNEDVLKAISYCSNKINL